MSKAMKKQVAKKKVFAKKKPANTMATLRAENDVLTESLERAVKYYVEASSALYDMDTRFHDLVDALRAISSMAASAPVFDERTSSQIVYSIRTFSDIHLAAVDAFLKSKDDDDDEGDDF